MKKLIPMFAALLALGAAPVSDVSRTGWDIVEDLTTEIGPRLAGTAAEARARDWAVQRLRQLGFSNVRIETYMMPVWVRGEERATITPSGQNLSITALGNSGATSPKGLEGEIVDFSSLEALKAAPDAQVAGKIVYVGHDMRPTQDGSSYGYFGNARRQGPNIAAKKGAAAIIIRSIGTDSHRMPHAGNTNWETGVKPIPAAALSNPDADQIERLIARARTRSSRTSSGLYFGPRLTLLLTPRFIGQQQSGNVIAEVPGTEPDAGLVVIGGHLDSWDLGTGAIDDGAGLAITTAAAKAILDRGKRPRRTIRVVWWGAEEVGAFGAAAYFKAHGNEPHALAAESDFGADRVWRMDLKLPEAANALGERLISALAPLGVGPGSQPARGGTDIGPLVGSGVPAVDLQQDGTRYFDLHHTADDTLDKIDPVQFAQNILAWTIMLDLVANAPEDLMAGRTK